ncbi:DNRLRE domain-containing protein [Paenibacillus sp. O199]|uniref:CBM96 family carbohydrate-binding protein n=1 Tax=Paenibacillus sp. O199 TaxID=1643925 RepID=UPI0007BFA5C6|nr:DNRLRE domain-containing protein [Paenibacillus sp. O199]
MYYADHDTEGVIYVKSPSNRFTSKYVLYVQDETNLESELVIASRKESTLNSTISIKSSIQNKDISSSLNIMYRSYSNLDSTIEAVAFSEIECSINVRPHNRAQGRFELIEAPRITIDLKPIGDATTRSRIDLQTINYGDTQRMMIGHDTIEEFESFVNFGDLNVAIPDLLYLEDAKLRLYYTGSIKAKANIEIYQPNTVWREYGITYANKPHSIELLANQYILNTTEKYIEFDVLDVLKQWQDDSLINYGFNIRSNDDTPIYFNTRESTKPPILRVKYITSAVQSFGRSEIDSELYIYQRGIKDVNSTITVKSDRGFSYLDSSIYVHRYEDPLFYDFNSSLAISRPDLYSSLTVGIRVEEDLESCITIIENKVSDLDTTLTSSRPDLASMITIDPKISLISEISIANRTYSDIANNIIISKPDLSSYINISNYTRTRSDMDSELSIRNEYYDDLDSFITISNPDTSAYLVIRGKANSDIDGMIDIPTYHFQDGTISVSRPDIDGFLIVKEIGYSEVDSFIDVPAFDDFESNVAISRPDLYSMLEVKYVSDQDGTIYIKDRVYLDSVIDIRQFSDLESTILIKQFTDTDSEVIISKPELGGFLYPRVGGLYDIDGLVSIRKRDVSDMNSTLIIRGASSGAYYYIL